MIARMSCEAPCALIGDAQLDGAEFDDAIAVSCLGMLFGRCQFGTQGRGDGAMLEFG
jgi:hypothetical protein